MTDNHTTEVGALPSDRVGEPRELYLQLHPVTEWIGSQLYGQLRGGCAS